MSARNVMRGGLPFAAALTLALGATAIVACGGRSDAPVPAGDTDASASAASADAGGEVLRPGVAYQSGGFDCCAKGIGRECCAPGIACSEYGGTGACVPAGGGISGKEICSICCDGDGTSTILRMRLVDGECVSDAPNSIDTQICAACGDGVCNAAAHENVCNCPEDCR